MPHGAARTFASYSHTLAPHGRGSPGPVGRRRGPTAAPRHARGPVLGLVAALVLTLAPFALADATSRGVGTPLDDWAVRDGYALEPVADGLVFPTSLAAVPEPGPGPDDPKLFVAELAGALHILTKDDRLLPFGHVTTVGTQTADLDGASQQGLAGVCLDPAHGYVFATFTMVDARGILRNHMVRFDATPGSLAGPVGAPVEVDPVLATAQSAAAHQIGNCQVVGDRLFVGVGDGGRASAAREPSILLGKVLCLGLQGGPCGDGPWAESPDDRRPAAYVWALGFRNPFALVATEGKLFVGQNGVDIDGFAEVRRGGDYGWAGTDQEIAAGSSLVLIPSISPVQMIRVGAHAPWAAPEDAGRFLVATFGGSTTSAGVLDLSSDPPGARPVPRYFVEQVGHVTNRVGGIASGADGLYLAPMLPLADGSGSLLRLRYDPEAAHGLVATDRGTLVKAANLGLLQTTGCSSCHAIGHGGGGIGPTLDRFGLQWRLTERLNASGYAEQVAAVDALAEEPYRRYAKARAEVLKAHDLERTWVWLKYYLQEPRFDNPDVAMPNLGLSQGQALALRAELFKAVGLSVPARPANTLAGLSQRAWRSRRAVGAGMVLGLVLAGLVLAAAAALRRRRARA